MAFVFKAKRGKELTSTTENIGPGEYIGQSSFKDIKTNKEPFLTSEKRVFGKRLNDNPGPGTYYQDDVLVQCLKNAQLEKLAIQSDKDNLLVKNDILGVRNTIEKFGFSTKEKRFKYKEVDTQPGPGSYFPKLLSQTARCGFSIKRKEKVINGPDKSCFSNIPSIPVKNQCGFEINKKTGQLKQKENPEMYKTFTGEKGDTVGPGSYELDVPSHWHKTGTEWSKLKEERSQIKKNISNQSDDNQIVSMQTTRYSDNYLSNGLGRTTMTTFKLEDKNAIENLIMNNVNNCNNENNKEEQKNETPNSNETYVGSDFNISKNLNEKKNIMNCRINIVKTTNQKGPHIDNSYLNNVNKFTPGPGYYFGIDKQTSFKKKGVPEFKQFFGSKAARFQKSKTNKDIGPTTYFQHTEDDTNQVVAKEKSSRINRKLIPFSSRANRFTRESKSMSPGPGQYQAQSEFDEKKFNNTFYKFGSNQIRFFDDKATKWKNEVPGPGSYLTFYNNRNQDKKIFDEFSFMRYTLNRVRSLSKNEELKDLRQLKDALQKQKAVPPVGLYNSDLIFSINYNNQKKARQNAKLGDVAFSTSVKKRFSNSQKGNENIGPGYYYREKKIKKKEVGPPFLASEKKDKGDSKSQFITGPGQYNLDSYFDWNKRTYNVNFI